MGNSTGSTMYMFGAVIVIYIVGMLLYQGFQWIKKKRAQKKDEEFRNSEKEQQILKCIKIPRSVYADIKQDKETGIDKPVSFYCIAYCGGILLCGDFLQH